MKEYNLLNDNSYATMYVKDKSKIAGKRKIKYTLLQNELEKLDNNELKNAAYEMALKKYKVISKREADEYKLMQKLYRFLMGKGYDYDLIKDVVKSIVKSEDF